MLVRCFALILLAGTATLGTAQAPGWSGPASGLIYDAPTKSLRRIAGLLGAAQLSKPIVEDLSWASVAPNGQRALAQASSGELVWLEGLGRSAFSTIPLSVPAQARFQAQWGSDSIAARLYSGDCNCLVTFALDSSGVLVQSGEPQFLDPSAGAVLDFIWKDTVTVLATDKGLLQIRGGNQAKQLFPAESELTFQLEGSGKAWAVRTSSGEIFEVVLPFGREVGLRLVAIDLEHLADLAGVASVPGALLAADRKTQSIYRIELDSGVLAKVCDLDAAPERMTPLGDRAHWLIRERATAGEPIFVLDGASTPRVFFVPGGDPQ